MDKVYEVAIFTGDDGSMGFCNGQPYMLEVTVEGRQICVRDCVTRKWVPYDTLSALVKNWDFKKYGGDGNA